MSNSNVDEQPFEPILHGELWSIVKNVSRYADSESENQAVSELTKMFQAHKLQWELEARLDEQQRTIAYHTEDGDVTFYPGEIRGSGGIDQYERIAELTKLKEGK